jgi:Tol biopolymer transport system component/serine/threonine protein kinase
MFPSAGFLSAGWAKIAPNQPMLGTTLEHYRIDREIGSGGMGVVYAAEDLKLHRQIAIKVISGPLALDAEFRQRFEREAQAVAALNHPNIVTIHSVEQAGDVHFLTMELVEGQPLSQWIPPGGLPLDRMLKLAVPLADAVSAAHQRGITHRDLKPANVMVAADGRVKVLDFGLAKLKEEGQAPGATTLGAQTITGEGRILGTVAYMSPEQAEGKAIDHRSDVFSLGVVFYEMATGQRPFKGDTSVSVISSILKDTPRAITDVNRDLPRDLNRIVRRCLMKDPDQRYQSAKDMRNDLQELAQALESGEIAPPASTITAPRTGNRKPVAWIALAAVALVAAAFAAIRYWPRSDGPQSRPLEATFTQITAQKGVEEFPSLSPDGKWVVYTGDAAGNRDIYLQSASGQNPINLTQDTPDDDFQPVFSPDGERIAFRSSRDGGGLFVMGRTGESVKRVTDRGYNPAWSPTGTEIVFGTENIQWRPGARGLRSALWIVNVETGEKRQITSDDAVQPSWSPNGHRIAFWAARGPQRQRDIVTVGAGGGDQVLVTDDATVDWNPVWSPDGRYLYFSSERAGSMNVWRVPIDERSGRVQGPPQALTAPSRLAAHLSVSADGRRLAYSSIDVEQNVQRVAFDPAAEQIVGEPQWVTRGSRLWTYMGPSADGQSVALSSGSPQEDIFIARADGSGLRQLTDDAAFDRLPRWSPDGKQIAFYSNRSGSWDVWRINADGSGLTAVTAQSGAHYPVWSPDGSRLAFTEIVDVARVSIVDLRKPWQSQTPERVPNPPGATWRAMSWSPDGRSLAGCQTQGTSPEGILVYLFEARTFTRLTEEGCDPYWLSDNRLIFTKRPGTLAVIDRDSRKVRDVLSMRGEDVLLQGVTRDGRQLFVMRSSREADVWMAAIK